MVVMTSSVLTERAMRAAAQVAREAGLRLDQPVVLSDGSNLLLGLGRGRQPAVVARVAATTAAVRAGDAWLAREVAVAGHLAFRGAPVVAPSGDLDPGPHGFAGLTMTFWDYAEAIPDPVDGARAGAALRDCHAALADFPGELPAMAVMHEAEQVVAKLARENAIAPEDAALLRAAGAEAWRRTGAAGGPAQAVHGDAHLGNVINTADGPLWNDWEDTFLGPTAWDLGCLVASARAFSGDPAATAAALRGYGDGVPAHEVLDAFAEARRWQGTVWSLVAARDHPETRARAQARLAWFRGRS